MGWIIAFGVVALVWWLAIGKGGDRRGNWVVHMACGLIAAFIGAMWWTGGAADRERQDLLRWADSPEGRAAMEASSREAAAPQGGGDGLAVEACVDRGVSYFIEIDAWPALSDGRDARAVARERCRRTVTAFP